MIAPIEMVEVTIVVPIDTHARLSRQARREFVDKTELLRKALYSYLEREESIYRKSRYYHAALYPEGEGQ
jgi:predicted transcriptional regulator